MGEVPTGFQQPRSQIDMNQHVTLGSNMNGVQEVAGSKPVAPTSFLPDVTLSHINKIAVVPGNSGAPALSFSRGLKTTGNHGSCWRVSNTVPTTVNAAPVHAARDGATVIYRAGTAARLQRRYPLARGMNLVHRHGIGSPAASVSTPARLVPQGAGRAFSFVQYRP